MFTLDLTVFTLDLKTRTVIFSTGEHKAGEEECISCEVHTVRELLRGAGGGAGGAHPGHCSRGDSSQRHLLPHRPNTRLVPSLLAGVLTMCERGAGYVQYSANVSLINSLTSGKI